jgi:two-component system, NtrC family, response regulator PilR
MERILIIDEDEEMGSLLRDFLREEGYQIEVTRNVTEARDILSRKLFNLVITGLPLAGSPAMNILPVIKRLQPGVSILVITASGSGEILRRSIEMGASAYLEKPVHFPEIRALVHDLLSPHVQKKYGAMAGFPPNGSKARGGGAESW